MKIFVYSVFFILINLNSIKLSAQFNYEFNIDNYKAPCSLDELSNVKNENISFKVSDTCNDIFFVANLVSVRDKYFRDGMNVWYFDKGFARIKTLAYYSKSNINGYIKEFYFNGYLKFEGICKTIKYQLDSKNQNVLRIDQNDTTIFGAASKNIYSKIKEMDKSSFIDSLLGVKRKNVPNTALITFPYYQKQKFGLWKYYDDTGKLIKEEFYEKGKLIRTKKK